MSSDASPVFSDRWNKKIEDKLDNRRRDLGEKCEKYLDRPLTMAEKVQIIISVSQESKKKVPTEDIKYDLSVPEERLKFEETNPYVFYFLTNIPLFCNAHSLSISKRDNELAIELGYNWEDYRLIPQYDKKTMDELLEDACYKYGFTYDGVLKEQNRRHP